MQKSMREIADVVQQHGVVGLIVELSDGAGPAFAGRQFGDFRNESRGPQLRVAREDEDQTVTLQGGQSVDAELWVLGAVKIVGDVGESGVIVGPAMVGTGQTAAFDLAFTEFDAAVSTAVLEGVNLVVRATIHGNRSPPERC